MTVSQPPSIPTPPELAEAPEHAVLALLDNALYAAAFALLARNPHVAEESFDRNDLDRRELLAEAIIKHADVMQTLLRRYRDASAVHRWRVHFRRPEDDAF